LKKIKGNIWGGIKMFKLMSFLTKKEGMSMGEFIDYYENHHVPLIASLAPVPNGYKRNFVLRDNNLSADGDFDVITEMFFEDREAFETWLAKMYAPDTGVIEDEMRFLDRTKTRPHLIEEYATSN
jgi:hypothetical protein